MIERNPATEQFRNRMPEMATVYKEAFAGFPWYEQLSIEETFNRVANNSEKAGFDAFLAFASDGSDQIVGGLWYDKPTLEELEKERGFELREFVELLGMNQSTANIVWEREVLVKPGFQGLKIATNLRTLFISYVSQEMSEGGVILTRMRDDNLPIIKVAENVGYQRTGIKVASSQNPSTKHEYWYSVLGAFGES